MFEYTLSGKTIENGQNRITVDYTNGTVACAETFFFTSKKDLDNRITNKIADLDKVVALDSEIITKDYVKTEKTPDQPVPPTAIQVAETKLRELKQLIDLGVINETDQEYVDAVAEYKLADSHKV